MSENMSERRVSRRANKGKPPKRFSYSSSTSSRSSQRQASREVELLEAELRTQEEVAKLEQKKLEVSLELARKRLLLEKSRDFRRGEQSEGSSDSSSEDEEFFDTVTGLESQLSSTSYSIGQEAAEVVVEKEAVPVRGRRSGAPGVGVVEARRVHQSNASEDADGESESETELLRRRLGELQSVRGTGEQPSTSIGSTKYLVSLTASETLPQSDSFPAQVHGGVDQPSLTSASSVNSVSRPVVKDTVMNGIYVPASADHNHSANPVVHSIPPQPVISAQQQQPATTTCTNIMSTGQPWSGPVQSTPYPHQPLQSQVVQWSVPTPPVPQQGYSPIQRGSHIGTHLKPLELPKFNGSEKNYVAWRQKFMNLVDADIHTTIFYKMARLREAVAGGTAEELIADIMDGPGAYQAAMAEIEAWYGGEDRQLERHEKEILSWPKISNEKDTEKLKKFALKLRSVLVNMRSCNIQPGRELYLSATQKIPSPLLLKFFERHNDRDCNIQQFADWLIDLVHMLHRVDERQEKPMAPASTTMQPQKPKRHQSQTLAVVSQSSHQTNKARSRPPVSCKKCGKEHQLSNCPVFTNLTTRERWDFVKPLNVCTCCLRIASHRSSECNAQTCSRCGRKHHILLHSEPSNSSRPEQSTAASTDNKQATSSSERSTSAMQASVNVATSCLKTNDGGFPGVSFMSVPVQVRNGDIVHDVTALLDPASSISFIREDLARELSLTGEVEVLTTTVLSGKSFTGLKERVQVSVSKCNSDEDATFAAFVLPTITAPVKTVDWNIEKLKWPHLLDVQFPKQSQRAQVDILIGLNAPQLHASLQERHGSTTTDPIARLTPLGWVCFGPHPDTSQCNASVCFGMSHSNPEGEQALDDLVRNFWDLERVGMDTTYRTPDERQAEEIVSKSLQHDGTRFSIGIPWTAENGTPNLRSNRRQAEQRLWSLERSLAKRPDVQQAYSNVIEKYLIKHYIKKVDPEKVSQDGLNQWYLPHFPVVRNDRATTKVRVVFDASVQSDGVSMNDEMYAGRKTQNNLVHVLLRFCAEPVALVGDISEMFLQIQLQDSDRKYHRFLWRTAPDKEPDVFEFGRVVFGVKASPYLAGRALEECAKRFGSKYSDSIPAIVHNDFYVDDLLHSFPDQKIAQAARSEIKELLQEGGFHIRKWLSNSEEVMRSIPAEDRAPNTQIEVGDHDHSSLPSTKTLGVTWNAADDKFTFIYSATAENKTMTKRSVLKKMSTIFDPRGQITPFTVRSRLLFQQLCIKGYGWDDILDEDDSKLWSKWFSELPTLSAVQVDRCFKLSDQLSSSATVEVHTFVDASDSAYAATSYVRALYPNGAVKTTLTLSKARPSPIRKLTIPKLELKAAVLGVKLSREVETALNIPIKDHVFWTDSMNVLYWVRSLSRKFQTDIGTKISEIHASTSGSQWRHIPGRLNPADLPSRGVPAEVLVNSSVWWRGPDFLMQDTDKWPTRDIVVPSQLPGQTKRSMAAVLNTVHNVSEVSEFRLAPHKYSSWTRLIRVTAWTLRFICQCLKAVKKHSLDKATNEVVSPSSELLQVIERSDDKTTVQTCSGGTVATVSELSSAEIQCAKRYWISKAQQEVYGKSISQLRQGKPLPKNDSLLPLNPGLDKTRYPAVMEVRGRLQNAERVIASACNPIILPHQHPVTTLIIAEEDANCHHTFGTNYVLANIRQQFWIIRGKQAVKSYRHTCNGCKRRNNKPATQLMGQLPSVRVAVTERAFTNTGVDYAGPFLTRQGRGKTQAKRYLCLFTCLETRACHLEMAYDLTCEGFLMCLSRFRKRRGTPRNIVSDNGLNFVAAEKELRQAVQRLSGGGIAADLAIKNINWKFNPPASPHHGGVFESLIKSAKRAIYAVIGRSACYDEELQTVFTETEGLLNARPLTTISDDPNDMSPLTPQHFLIGHNDMQHPVDHDDRRSTFGNRWRVVQSLVHDVWKRLVKEMMPVLNIRQKWRQKKRNLKIGDVVICVDQHTPRGFWPLGRIANVYPAADGHVRIVDVKIKQKVYRRSINVLIPLEVEE